jgi:hypothetical protein
MNKRRVLIGLTLVATALALAATVHAFTRRPVAQAVPLRLKIIGPEGQRFSGSYTADGVTTAVSAVAPATVSVDARELAFQFNREGGTAGEFRVAVFVGDLCRTSTTSDTRQGVRGEFHHTATSESYWAAGF